jgi:uncharacterized membrane protein YphA (DoxX/SURF4 family)
MNGMKYNKMVTWNYLLLLLRIWLGYRMIAASYSSVIDILTSPKERIFFEKWFGEELHYPIPLAMAFIAKSAELFGGIFLFAGLFTKTAAFFIVFTMFVATVTANLGENFVIDGGFTISYCLFGLIFILWGGGKFSLDHLLFKSGEFKNSEYSPSA